VSKVGAIVPATRKPSQSTVRNLLLGSLPSSAYEEIRPGLEVVPLLGQHILQGPGEVAKYIYFPGGGFISVVIVLEDGTMVEVATVGREGMAAVATLTPGRRFAANVQMMVQGESETCYRMSVDDYRGALARGGAFAELVGRFSDTFLAGVMQATGCNAMHSVVQRMAKWLLMAQDRMEAETFPLTQEFLAMMLGATRPTVTVVAGGLQKAGLISYKRGKVHVVNRAGLEVASCECYRATSAMFGSVIGSTGRALRRTS
jgi:CRP-like cAMP-binding protein